MTTPVATEASSHVEASSASTSPAAIEPTVRKIANGYFQFMAPADWKVKTLPVEDSLTGVPHAASLQVLNADGKLMATFTSGSEPVMDLEPGGSRLLPYALLDRGASNIDGNKYLFESLGKKADEANMAINAFDFHSDQAPFLSVYFNYASGGGSFYRAITPKTNLVGVPRGMTGQARLKAYTKTSEYSQVKAMLMSLRQLKNTVPSKEKTASCVGAKYTYDLEGSTLTFQEAKSFLQKLEGADISAGAKEIIGVGACEIPWQDHPGRCQVEQPSTTFEYSMK